MPSASQPSIPRGAGSRVRPVRQDWPSPAPPPAISIRPPWSVQLVVPDSDEVAVVQAWMSRPHLEASWGQAWSAQDWSAEVRDQLVGDHSRPWLVRRDGEPVAYLELCRIAVDVLGEKWPFLPDEHALTDLAIRIAAGDASDPAGPPSDLIAAILEAVFAAEPMCERVFATPAVADTAGQRRLRDAGFAHLAEVELPEGRVVLLGASRPPEPIEVERTPEGVLAALQIAYDRVKPDLGHRLSPTDDLFDDLDLDSLDVVDIIDALEGAVDVAVVEAALDRLTDHRTVGDLIAFVLPRL